MSALHTARFANFFSALFTFIIIVKFSSNYSTYAWIIGSVFILFDFFISYRNNTPIFPELNWSRIKLPLAGYLVLYVSILLASVFTFDISNIKLCLVFLKFSLPMWFIIYLNGKFNATNGILTGITAGSAVISGLGLYQWITHSVPENRIYSVFTPFPNMFGTMLILLLPFLFYTLFHVKKKSCKAIVLIVIAGMLISLLGTNSRGAVLGLAAAGIVCLVAIFLSALKSHTLSKKVVLSMFSMLILSCSALGYMGLINHNRFGSFSNFNNGEECVLLWKASYHMWQDHKVLGIGFAHFNEAYYSPQYHPAEGKEKNLGVPHSTPMHFLACTGLIGLIGYISHLATVIITLFKSLVTKHTKVISIVFLGAFTAFTTQGLIDMSITSKTPAQLYFLLFGFFLSTISRQK